MAHRRKRLRKTPFTTGHVSSDSSQIPEEAGLVEEHFERTAKRKPIHTFGPFHRDQLPSGYSALEITSTPTGTPSSIDVSVESNGTVPATAPHTPPTFELSLELDLNPSDPPHEDPLPIERDETPQSNSSFAARNVYRNRTTLEAVFLTRGSTSFTKEQFARIRRHRAPFVRAGVLPPLPHYSTLQSGVFRFISALCLPAISVKSIKKKCAITNTESICQVETVHPSSWARYDIANPQFWELVYNNQNSSNFHSFENTPFVQNRKYFLDETYSFQDSTLPSGKLQHGTTGDLISVTLDNNRGVENCAQIIVTGTGPILNGTVQEIGYNIPSQLRNHHVISTHLKAGDKLVGIKPDVDGDKWCLIYRFWRTKDDLRQRLLLRIRSQSNSSPAVTVHNVFAVAISPSHDLFQGSLNSSHTNQGLLPDGSPFCIYRFILFTDGFDVAKSMFKKRSTGAVYLMPMGLPSEYRKAPRFIHTVALSPPGIPAMHVIHTLIEDITNSSLEGLEVVNPMGEKVRVFLDLVGVLTDFHEASDGIATYHHSGIAGCNLCNFRRDEGSRMNSSAYGYNTIQSSGNSSFQRTLLRHESIQRANPKCEELQYLGLHDFSTRESNVHPLVHLESTLREKLRVSERFLPGKLSLHYRAFQCAIVAPDHCIIGNIKNVLTLTFKSLPNRTVQKALNKLIYESLTTNGLDRDKHVYNEDKQSLRSVSFSTLFGIFQVIPPVLAQLRSILPTSSNPDYGFVLRTVLSLHKLVVALYHWPDVHLEGAQAMNYYFGTMRKSYFETLHNLTVLYISNVNNLFRNAHPHAKVLDVPNLHRLLELVIHTVPKYGHVRHISDLTFEHKHQALKSAYQRGSNQEPGNWALRTDLMEQWKQLVASTHHLLSQQQLPPARQELFTQYLFRIVLGIRSEDTNIPFAHLEDSEKKSLLQELFTPSLTEDLTFTSTRARSSAPQRFRVWKFPSESHSYMHYINFGLRDEVVRTSVRTLLRARFTNAELRTARFARAVTNGSNKTYSLQPGNLFNTTKKNSDSSILHDVWSYFYSLAGVQDRREGYPPKKG